MADILFVDDNVTERGLAALAVTLRRPELRFAEAEDLEAARELIARERPRLTILGWRALHEGALALGAGGPVLGFAAGFSDADKARALAAGVQAVYERPNDWARYCDALEKILDEWLK